MNYCNSISERFLDYLRSDIDTSVELGLPDNLHRLGDPSPGALEQRVAEAQKLIAAIDVSQGEDFYQVLDLQLMRRYLQQDVWHDTLQINGAPERFQKPAGVDGVSEGIFQLFVNDERDSESRLSGASTTSGNLHPSLQSVNNQ